MLKRCKMKHSDFRPQIDTHVLWDPSWWHWAVTVPLLALHLAGYPVALAAAIALCAVMAAYFWSRVGAWRPFPAQIRLAYLGLLFVGGVPGFAWMHWFQLIGTTAMVLVGYCPLGRMLSLLSWNRHQPLSWSLVARTISARPSGGVVALYTAGSDEAGPACCSLERRAGVAAGQLKQTGPQERIHASAH